MRRAVGENVGLEIQNIKEVVGGLVMVCLSVDGDSSKGNDAAKMMGATLLEISCNGHHNSKAVTTREMSA
uniref:Uncharacterized protein n=1 Tax=Triticum urartu TaxID=4572 RepID=A0A8R7UAF5_TRIUA